MRGPLGQAFGVAMFVIMRCWHSSFAATRTGGGDACYPVGSDRRHYGPSNLGISPDHRIFGIIGLAGVVINNSLVMVDNNELLDQGLWCRTWWWHTCSLRPILLTR